MPPNILRIFTILLAGAISSSSTAAPAPMEVGQTVQDVKLRGLNGRDRNLKEFLGRPLLINVWASWCGPCREEMGSLERLAWRDQSKTMVVIGVSTDDSEPAAKAYLRNSNATLSHFIDSGLAVENMLGANRLPLTVLINDKGKIVGKFYGARQWDQPEASRWIESGLKKK